jgi:transcriptional regulator of NAD metabolism
MKDVEKHFRKLEASGPLSGRGADLLDRSRQMQEFVEEMRREKLELPNDRVHQELVRGPSGSDTNLHSLRSKLG